MKTETAITVLLVVVAVVVLVGAAVYALVATVGGIVDDAASIANNWIDEGGANYRADVGAADNADKRSQNNTALGKVIDFLGKIAGGAASAVAG